MYKRGEIYYIERYPSTGSEQTAGRPAIIVSNDKNNMFSSVVEVVFLTTQTKNDLPTHVEIRSGSKLSTALCEQVNSISTDRVGDYGGMCTDAEMKMIDTALAISLGIDLATPTEVLERPVVTPSVKSDDFIKAETERDTYKKLYEQLLERLIKGA